MHLLSVWFVFLLLRIVLNSVSPDRQSGEWAALAGALFFGIHPVQVESVAWITERKNVMSLFFSLASLLAWLRFAEPRGGSGRRFYLASLIFYALALSSKVTACTLPAVQLLLRVITVLVKRS